MTLTELADVLDGVNDIDSRLIAADALEEAGFPKQSILLREPTNQVCQYRHFVFMLGLLRWVRSDRTSVYLPAGHDCEVRISDRSWAGQHVVRPLREGGIPGNMLHIDDRSFRAIRKLFPRWLPDVNAEQYVPE